MLFRWSVIDCLESCPAQRNCATCGLFADCGGRAKKRSPEEAGHVTIDDALALKARVGQASWESEMLCLRPSRQSSVYPEFDPDRHVIDAEAPEQGRWFAGMDFGFRAPSVVLWGHLADDGVLRILHERIVEGATLARHIEAITGAANSDSQPHDSGRPPRPYSVAIDPAGRQVNDQTGISNAEALRKAGLVVKATPMRIHPGIMLVRARLAPASGAGPRLLIHRRCRGLVEALSQYHYPLDRPESLEPVKDGPDHAADALRYLIANLDRVSPCTRGRYA